MSTESLNAALVEKRVNRAINQLYDAAAVVDSVKWRLSPSGACLTSDTIDYDTRVQLGRALRLALREFDAVANAFEMVYAEPEPTKEEAAELTPAEEAGD